MSTAQHGKTVASSPSIQ